MKTLCSQHKLKALTKEYPYFKNIMNPPSINLFLKNFSKYFLNTLTSLSDFYKFIYTVLKINFLPKIKNTETTEYLIMYLLQ